MTSCPHHFIVLHSIEDAEQSAIRCKSWEWETYKTDCRWGGSRCVRAEAARSALSLTAEHCQQRPQKKWERREESDDNPCVDIMRRLGGVSTEGSSFDDSIVVPCIDSALMFVLRRTRQRSRAAGRNRLSFLCRVMHRARTQWYRNVCSRTVVLRLFVSAGSKGGALQRLTGPHTSPRQSGAAAMRPARAERSPCLLHDTQF